MKLGVCYYPEQWPRDRWAVDARLMAEAGLTHVRIGEFAWAAYEPERGRFEWGWLDAAIDTLAAAGLEVILGTPAATPPIWLALERPEILSIDSAGRRQPYGTRRHTCPTSPEYRGEVARVVETLASRYGSHPAVVGWQIDNEPGNHDSARCWCSQCEAAFAVWLGDRYGSVDALNAAWGTIFWSQVYPDFDAVRLPRPAPTAHSPSLLLAHRRFASAQVVAGLKEQAAIIRSFSPDRDLTVNFYAGDTFVDYRAVARIGGIGAIDSYPHGASSPEEVRFWHALARGIGGGGRGWIMEQQPGAINWTPTNPPVPDGQVTAWLEDAAVDGIELTLLFRWRAALAGQEQYHTGMLRHDGTPDRAYREVSGIALPEPSAPAQVALLYEYEDAWAFEIEPHLEGLTHRAMVVAAFTAARRLGPVDVVSWHDDLSPYTTLVAPATLLGSPDKAATVRNIAEAGATVIIGPRSFTRDEESVALSRPVPVHLDLPISVDEGLSFPDPSTIDSGGDGGRWIDVLADAGSALGRFTSPHVISGRPVATACAVGQGRIVLMGASSQAAWSRLLDDLGVCHPKPKPNETS